MDDSPLLVALRMRGLLSEDEEALLRAPDVTALAPRAQLDYLASNRRVGAIVTAIAGGVRLALVVGALVAHAVLVATGHLAFWWGWLALWAVLGGLLLWLVPSFVRRVRSLSETLPTYEALGLRGP